MSKTTWDSDAPPPEQRRFSLGDWLRVIRRGLPLALLVFGGLAVMGLIRVVERPLFGPKRPWTPWITVAVCRGALRLLGMGHVVTGSAAGGTGALVANHSSWLDIFAINATQPLYFVSKSEVARWPGIGWLARATGTVFIKRQRGEARAQVGVFEDRLNAGHRLVFFPEGTSTDGMQVLAFKPTLFAAFFADGLREAVSIQPVTLRYLAPLGADPRLYGWWGDMDFGPHLLATLAAAKQGRLEVVFHAPVRVADYADRKALAAALEATVRSGLGKNLDERFLIKL